MKLITSKGQLALPNNFSFSVEKESPFYGDNGTATIPINLPVSQDTFAKLGRPERLGQSQNFLRKLPAKLELELYIRMVCWWLIPLVRVKVLLHRWH